MNVSSVKNLNGETFSAVQDATLTNVVQTNSGKWNEISAYELASANYLTSHQDISNLMPKSESANFYPMTGNPSGFINNVEFEELNLSSFATSSQISALSAAIDYVSANVGDEYPISADEAVKYVQTNSSTINDVNTSYQTNSGTFLTAHQSLNGLMSASLLEYSGSVITAYDGHKFAGELSGDQADAHVNEWVYTNSGKCEESNSVVETNSANWNTISDKLDTTSFSDVSGSFLTAVDLSNYYTKSETSGASEIADALANIPTGNPEVENYVQTNSGTIDDTVTSFQTNSSTYMVEPNLEYNAVGEISGYGNSAIAQYGAEKQWLQHDDTIVSISNSAQYAFGCNISALQRLMGIDETVLYNNTAATTADVAIGSTFDISEPITNFNKFKIYFSRFSIDSTGASNGGPCSQIREYDSTACSAYFVINETFPTSTASNTDWFDISMLIETISGNTWKCKACYQSKLPSGSLDKGWKYLKPYKVIGIGRRS